MAGVRTRTDQSPRARDLWKELLQPGMMSRPLSRNALLALQHANYADDLDLPAEAAGWTSEEAEAFFASGGAVSPAWTGVVRRLAEGSGVPSSVAEQLIALRITLDIMMDASVAQLKLYASEAGSTLGALLHMRLAAERGVAAPTATASSELDGELGRGVARLDDECVLLLMRLVPPGTVAAAACVCKRWRSVADGGWRLLLDSHWAPSQAELRLAHGMEIGVVCGERTVWSRLPLPIAPDGWRRRFHMLCAADLARHALPYPLLLLRDAHDDGGERGGGGAAEAVGWASVRWFQVAGVRLARRCAWGEDAARCFAVGGMPAEGDGDAVGRLRLVPGGTDARTPSARNAYSPHLPPPAGPPSLEAGVQPGVQPGVQAGVQPGVQPGVQVALRLDGAAEEPYTCNGAMGVAAGSVVLELVAAVSVAPRLAEGAGPSERAHALWPGRHRLRLDVLDPLTHARASLLYDCWHHANAARWVRTRRRQPNLSFDVVPATDGRGLPRLLLRATRAIAPWEALSASDFHLLSGPRSQRRAAAEPQTVREEVTRPEMQHVGLQIEEILRLKGLASGGAYCIYVV